MPFSTRGRRRAGYGTVAILWFAATLALVGSAIEDGRADVSPAVGVSDDAFERAKSAFDAGRYDEEWYRCAVQRGRGHAAVDDGLAELPEALKAGARWIEVGAGG